MGKAATATTKGVRCRIIRTPRPAFPWKIEVLPPHTADADTCYYFRSRAAALAALSEREWKIQKRIPVHSLLRFIAEYMAVWVLLIPVAHELFKEPISFLVISAPALCINPYTTVLTALMLTTFIHPTVKLILLMVSKPASDFEMGRFIGGIIANLFLVWGFFYLFVSALPNIPTATEILADLEAHRAEMVARRQLFPGMTVAEYYATPQYVDGVQQYPDHNLPLLGEQVTPLGEMDRIYLRLKEQASREAKQPLGGVHVYKLALNYVNDLWIQRNGGAKTK